MPYEEAYEVSEWERNTSKVNVWLGMTKSKLCGPFFFSEKSITGNIYKNTLELFLEPQLQDDGTLDTVVFQQDGAPPHFAHIVHEYMNRTFQGDGQVEGHLGCGLPVHQTLPPLPFFLQGGTSSPKCTLAT